VRSNGGDASPRRTYNGDPSTKNLPFLSGYNATENMANVKRGMNQYELSKMT
jgi:hypothetical protein